MKRIIYHGSDHEIQKPQYNFGNSHNDYGYGFYCCSNKSLAEEWASKREGIPGIVNEYEIRDDNLKILDLTKPPFDNVLSWVAILVHFRELPASLLLNYQRELDYLEKNYYIDVSQYDIVIGYRADDNYYQFPHALIRSEILIESLEEIFKLDELGKQYVLVSQKALNRLHFLNSYNSQMNYREYHNRKKHADSVYQSILENDRYKKGVRMFDLVRDK